MAVLPVVKYPDPRLREPTREVTEITDEIRQLVADLTETMYAENGAGIAAIQVGSPWKVYLVDAQAAGLNEGDPPLVFMNPEITWLSEDKQEGDEGCLSFPGVYLQVSRANRCRVRAMDLNGVVREVEGEGLFARAMQHEGDHLTGKLLIDFAGALKKEVIKRKMRKLARDEQDEKATG